ncbi:hypothetical protein BROUX41_005089 [Berkeleyomyces rouxiae]|uniref:uncharacterized protein n=1 Tax=Berkeleyomyces rouxiae TaxID=2035830 RepID=UPI003B829BBD
MTVLEQANVTQGREEQAFVSHFIAPPSVAPSDDIPVHLASYPPLAQVTQLPAQELPFIAVLEIPPLRLHEQWEVSLWSHVGSNEYWHEIPMSPLVLPESSPPILGFLQQASDNVSRLVFAHSVALDRTFSFTFKYRSGPNQPWRWIKEETGMADGTVITTDLKTSEIPSNITDIIRHLNPALTVKSRTSQSPGASVWRLQLDVDAETPIESVFTETSIGIPWGGCVKSFGLARASEPWLCPVHGKDILTSDKPIILSSFLNSKGASLVLLAVSGVNDVTTFIQSKPNGSLSFYTRNDGEVSQLATLVVAACYEVEHAIAAAVYEARLLVQGFSSAPAETLETVAAEDEAKVMWRETWYDGLGYCTWNALGQQLTNQKLYDALDQLASNNINISSLIIDDNWQSIDRNGNNQSMFRMTRFEALASAFPEGLKKTVANIKSKHPHIKHVAVWHTLLGYWGGISPDGEISKKYQIVEASRKHDAGSSMHVISANDVTRFYSDFYSFLSSCGIDGVKTDGQCMIDAFNTARDRRCLSKAYQDAWSLACLRWFSNNAISCMSQTPQIIFHSQLPRTKPPVVVRNSDDFFPHVPASHPWHVWANAYNSLLSRYLNVVPDWDMFQTVHEYAEFHAAARCVSGGPVYITDAPGEYNLGLIKKMTAETIRGRTIVLRPNTVARAADPYVGYHDNVLLKVISYHGEASGYPIMGVFNVSSRQLTELVHLTAFSGIRKSSTHEYIVRGFNSGKTSCAMNPSHPSSVFGVSLDVRGYEILTAYQLSSFKGRQDTAVDVATLGLLDKMTGAAAVLSNSIIQLGTGRVHIEVFIKALGMLGIYISKLPHMSIDKHFLVIMMGQVIPSHTVSISNVNPNILEIDVEGAWKEMELRSGWSNEVQVKIYFDVV